MNGHRGSGDHQHVQEVPQSDSADFMFPGHTPRAYHPFEFSADSQASISHTHTVHYGLKPRVIKDKLAGGVALPQHAHSRYHG